MKRALRLMALLVVIMIGSYSCASMSQMIKGGEEALITIEGEIDFLKQVSEIYPQGGEFTFVLIGFKDGNGIIAQGIHPGLKEGKKVKLYLKLSEIIYRGSSVNEIQKIEKVE